MDRVQRIAISNKGSKACINMPVTVKPTCMISETTGLISQHNTGQIFQIAEKELEVRGSLIEIHHSYNNDVSDMFSMKEPVYVTVQNGQEQLMYSTSRMIMDKLYKVEWNDENYALRKTKDGVEIFKFYPDEE